MENKKKKKAFEFGNQIIEQLEYLTQETGSTQVDIIRKSVNLYYDAFKEAHEKGGEVLFVNKKDGTRKIMI